MRKDPNSAELLLPDEAEDRELTLRQVQALLEAEPENLYYQYLAQVHGLIEQSGEKEAQDMTTPQPALQKG